MKGIIIGYGNMGRLHHRYYKQMGVEIALVEKRDVEIPYYESLHEAVDAEQPDFIDICTPTHLHYDHLKLALKTSLPLFVEKPVVNTQEQIRELRCLSTDQQKRIFVGEVEHYNRAIMQFLQEESPDRELRITRSVNYDYFTKGLPSWFSDEKLSGGIVLDLMIHDINLLVHHYGRPKIEKVSRKKTEYPMVDCVDVSLQFDTMSVHVHGDWVRKERKEPIYVKWENNSKNVVCQNYLYPQSRDDDHYYWEIHSFLEFVRTKRQKFPFHRYLDANEVALMIN